MTESEKNTSLLQYGIKLKLLKDTMTILIKTTHNDLIYNNNKCIITYNGIYLQLISLINDLTYSSKNVNKNLQVE